MIKSIKVDVARYGNEDNIVIIHYGHMNLDALHKEICRITANEPVAIEFGKGPMSQGLKDMFKSKGTN